MSHAPVERELPPGFAAGAVFDRLAASYDDDFTDSLIGRAQRNQVWKVLQKTFRAYDSILDLNCGTGEDAFFLAAQGISVVGCDASEQMVLRAKYRLQKKKEPLPIVFSRLSTERITCLHPPTPFNGVLSNFSGLNCVADLAALATNLVKLTTPGSKLLLCLSTRYCLFEILYYMLRGQPRKAWRRCTGSTQAFIDGAPITVYYPTLAQLRSSFAPYFQLRSVRGIGVAVPPSYLENWAQRHPRALHLLSRLETAVASLPLLRSTGDHMLLTFVRVNP